MTNCMLKVVPRSESFSKCAINHITYVAAVYIYWHVYMYVCIRYIMYRFMYRLAESPLLLFIAAVQKLHILDHTAHACWHLLHHVTGLSPTVEADDTGGAGLGSSQLSVSNPQGNPACTPVPNLQSALGLQQDPNSMHYQAINASVLVAFLIFLRFCVYVALRKKTARV